MQTTVRERLERIVRALGVTATVAGAIMAIALAAMAALPTWELPEPWFRPMMLTLVGALVIGHNTERSSLRNELRAIGTGNQLTGPFHSRERAYAAAASAVRDARADDELDQMLLVASLHGHSGWRSDSRTLEEPSSRLSEFLAFRDAIADRLRQGWRLRQVVSFPSERRLDEFLERWRSLPRPDRIELRAYLSVQAPPAVSLVVVANRETMLGVDDDRVYGVGNALRLSGRDVATWSTQYFDELWESAPYKLWRPALGEDAQVIRQMRAALRTQAIAGTISDTSPSGTLQVFRGTEASYVDANEELRRLLQTTDGISSIRLANLHGLSSARTPEEVDQPPWLHEFEELLDSCVLQRPSRITTQLVYNVNNEARWKVVQDYLERWRTAERLEVRVLSLTDAVSLLSPLIIGDRSLLLAVEDERLYRAGDSVHMYGRAAAAWGQRYFDSLWYDKRALTVHTPRGPDHDGIRRVQDMLAARSRNSG